MREVEKGDRKGEYEEPSVQGTNIRDLRYTDDMTLLSSTSMGLKKLIKSVKEHSDKKGLPLNVKKSKIMDTEKCGKEAVIELGGEEIERVESCEYFGARKEANGKTTPDIRRRLAIVTARLNKDGQHLERTK